MKEKIIIFYQEKYKDAFYEYTDYKERQKVYVLQYDEDIVTSPINNDFVNISYDDILTENELIEIDIEGSKIAESWYTEIGNMQLIKTIPMCHILEYEIRGLIVTVLKQIAFLERIGPNKIVVCDDGSLSTAAIRKYAETKEITLDFLLIRKKQLIDREKKAHNRIFLLKKTILKSLIWLSNIVMHLRCFQDKKKFILLKRFTHTKDIVNNLIKNKKCLVGIIEPELTDVIELFSKVLLVMPYKTRIKQDMDNHPEIIAFTNALILKNEFNYFVYKEISFWNEIKKYICIEINQIFPLLNYYSQLMGVITSKYQVNAIMMSQDWTGLERYLVYYGNQKKIQTYVMAHGMFLSPISEIHPIANQFFFWDNISRNYFIDIYKIDIHRLHLVKSVYFQSIKLWVQKYDRNLTYKKIGLLENKITILLLAPVWVDRYAYISPQEGNIFLKELCDEISSMQGYQCIVRFHPSTSYYEELNAKIKILNQGQYSNCVIDPGMDLMEALNACDIVIGRDSSVFFDALYLNKMLLIYNNTGKKFYQTFSALGVAKYVTKKDELNQAIISLSDKKEIKKRNRVTNEFLNCHICDGLNTGKICSMLLNL